MGIGATEPGLPWTHRSNGRNSPSDRAIQSEYILMAGKKRFLVDGIMSIAIFVGPKSAYMTIPFIWRATKAIGSALSVFMPTLFRETLISYKKHDKAAAISGHP